MHDDRYHGHGCWRPRNRVYIPAAPLKMPILTGMRFVMIRGLGIAPLHHDSHARHRRRCVHQEATQVLGLKLVERVHEHTVRAYACSFRHAALHETSGRVHVGPDTCALLLATTLSLFAGIPVAEA